MKKLILLFFISAICSAQTWHWNYEDEDLNPNNIITDSISWYLYEVQYPGDSLCQHEYIEGVKYMFKGFGCCVYHNGFHCDWTDMMLPKICKKCLRKEIWRENWYQHQQNPPETEYQKLEKKLKGKTDTSRNTGSYGISGDTSKYQSILYIPIIPNLHDTVKMMLCADTVSSFSYKIKALVDTQYYIFTYKQNNKTVNKLGAIIKTNNMHYFIVGKKWKTINSYKIIEMRPL